jgi:hypothetical protein
MRVTQPPPEDAIKPALPWASVVARLGGLADDPRPNVRTNLAMVAAALAPDDPEALRELARIAVDAILELISDAPASGTVLSTVLTERAQLDVARQIEFDQHVAALLLERAESQPVPPHSLNLQRLPDEAAALMPPRWTAAAILADASELAAMSPGARDRLRRESAQKAIERLARLDREGSVERQNALRDALQRDLNPLHRDERSGMIFVLLSAAPTLLAPSVDGKVVVRWQEMSSAVRDARPRYFFWRFARGLLDALIAAAFVAAPMAVVILYADPGNLSSILLDALGKTFALACFCFMSSVPLAVFYLPSVGGYFRPGGKWLWRLLYGVLAGLSVVASAALLDAMLSTPTNISLWGDGDRSGTLPLLVVATAANVLVMFGIETAYAYAAAVERFSNWPRSAAVAIAAGPAVLLTTAICSVAVKTHHDAIAQCWPRVMASTMAIAFTLYVVEAAAWPRRPRITSGRRWLPLVAVPVLLSWTIALCGIARTHFIPASALSINLDPPTPTSQLDVDLLTHKHVEIRVKAEQYSPFRLVVAADRSLDVQMPDKPDPSVPANPKAKLLPIKEKSYTTVTLSGADLEELARSDNGPMTLANALHSGGRDASAVVWAFPGEDPRSKAAASDETPHSVGFQLKPGLVLCVDGCEAKYVLPDAATWLRVLARGPTQLAHVRITAQGNSTSASSATSSATLTSASASTSTTTLSELDLQGAKVARRTMSAGTTLPIRLSTFAQLEVKAEGQGSLGSHASVAIVDPKTNHFVVWPGRPQNGDLTTASLPPGRYALCVYFGAADFPVCDVRQQEAHVIETGTATLEIVNRLELAPSIITLGGAETTQEMALPYGSNLHLQVQSRTNAEFFVVGQLTSNPPGSPVMTLTTSAGHPIHTESGAPAHFSALLEPGEYQLCSNTDSADACKEITGDSASNRASASAPGVVLSLRSQPAE